MGIGRRLAKALGFDQDAAPELPGAANPGTASAADPKAAERAAYRRALRDPYAAMRLRREDRKAKAAASAARKA